MPGCALNICQTARNYVVLSFPHLKGKHQEKAGETRVIISFLLCSNGFPYFSATFMNFPGVKLI